MKHKRPLQEIVRESANRYGLAYNPNQNKPTVRIADGSIHEVEKEDFPKLFGIEPVEKER